MKKYYFNILQVILWISLLIWGWTSPIFAAIKQINDCHIYSQYWRLVIETSQPIRYHMFTLENPNRLVVDIINSHLVPIFLHQPPLVYNTPIQNMRSSMHDQNIRIVFDLKIPIKVKSCTLKRINQQDYHLVLNLLPSSVHWRVKKIENKKKLLIQPKKKIKRRVVVVIDPGHGGKDPGATGFLGTPEKNIVLQISKALAKDVNAQPGFIAQLTRRSDDYLSLRQRLFIARKYKADIFVAIHADAYKIRSAHGASVFSLSKRGATSEAARWLAQRENASELVGGLELKDKTHLLKSVLISLSQTVTIRESLLIGQCILHALGNVEPLHHRCVEQADFVVLKSPDIPSVLIETGFISNASEEKKLRSLTYQRKIAAAIMRGIRTYFAPTLN